MPLNALLTDDLSGNKVDAPTAAGWRLHYNAQSNRWRRAANIWFFFLFFFFRPAGENICKSQFRYLKTQVTCKQCLPFFWAPQQAGQGRGRTRAAFVWTQNPWKILCPTTSAAVYDTTAYFQEASVPTAVVSLHDFCFTAGRTPVERHWRRHLTNCREFTMEQNKKNKTHLQIPNKAEFGLAILRLYVGHKACGIEPWHAVVLRAVFVEVQEQPVLQANNTFPKTEEGDREGNEGGRGRKKITFDLWHQLTSEVCIPEAFHHTLDYCEDWTQEFNFAYQ